MQVISSLYIFHIYGENGKKKYVELQRSYLIKRTMLGNTQCENLGPDLLAL